MPGYGFADKNNPEKFSSKSKRRQRINKRGHPRSKGCKPRPFSRQAFADGYDGIDWSKAPWNKLTCTDCGTADGVMMQPCPRAEELHNDGTEHPLCDYCANQRARDI